MDIVNIVEVNVRITLEKISVIQILKTQHDISTLVQCFLQHLEAVTLYLHVVSNNPVLRGSLTLL